MPYENHAPAAVDLSTQTYLSVDEAVIYLRRRNRHQVYDWARRHRIPKCRMGRDLLFLRRDLDEAVRGVRSLNFRQPAA